MGGDGGTCCKARSIMTKTKKEKKKQDREYEVNAKWTFCSISGKSLTKPIVSCQLGKLYNKDAIIEFLLDRAKQPPETQRRLKHIKGLKDVVELKLTANPSHRTDAHGTQHGAKYHCPISTLEMNGRHKFGYILSTGNVISDRAIQQLKEDNMIIDPSNEQKYPLDDIIYINLEEEIDIEKQLNRMKARKEAKKASKANKRQKAEGEEEAPKKKKKSIIVPQRLEKSTINSRLNTITRTSIKDGAESVKNQKQKSEVLSALFTSHDSFIGDLTAEALAGRTANMATAAIQKIKNGVRSNEARETQKNLKYARYKAGGLNN
ncbi:Oidioi.mRNA.OKI2018_I69.chr2.g6127.t1.cds [Oikopleura dioica]|uniref:Replication termination factor 2 n=1 Tax=Oikopleura dioica TaxID=34765 RepID=A0ABN7T843_OIKDI|nr:Oidioi.mRNA.OKI2018_I69.chr2.g6127.t1.cds [Oikopleura dioica]